MNSATLVLPRSIASQLADVARIPLETAGVLLAGVGDHSGGLRILGRELHLLPDSGYDIRLADRLNIPSQSYVPALARAEEIGATALFFHSHPHEKASPHPSEWDVIVDDAISELFQIRTGSETFASFIVSPRASFFTFTGHGINGDGQFNIDRIFVSGDRLALIDAHGSRREPLDPIFDRQVRAFGGGVQAMLGRLRVGIVGAGGTGSAVAEQLVRLGLRSLVIVDDDVIDDTNVTRVYGSALADIGRFKVDVITEHLLRIAPGASIAAIPRSLLEEDVARKLTECDVLFGCTDDNAGRLTLTRLAAHYLTPYIDCGVLITSVDGRIRDIVGRATTQTPGTACLVCRDRIDLAQAAAEQLPADERVRRQREGYVPGIPDAQPAVVAFTTAIASQAVAELLERFSAYGAEPVPSEVLIRFHDREVSTTRVEPRPGHYCHPDAGVLGKGDSDPFIGQLWRSA